MPYVTVGNLRNHYEVEGAGDPLVLLHGISDSLASWYDFGYVEALAPDYQLILVDLLGHGDSDKPHDPDAYRYEAHADHVIAVLDAVGVPATHLLGYSMGGFVAG